MPRKYKFTYNFTKKKNKREFTWFIILIYSSWAKKFSGCEVVVEKTKTHIIYKYIKFLIPGHLRDKCKKYGWTRQAISYVTKYVAKGGGGQNNLPAGKLRERYKLTIMIFNTNSVILYSIRMQRSNAPSFYSIRTFPILLLIITGTTGNGEKMNFNSVPNKYNNF